MGLLKEALNNKENRVLPEKESLIKTALKNRFNLAGDSSSTATPQRKGLRSPAVADETARPTPTPEDRTDENLRRAIRANKQKADLQRISSPVEKALGAIAVPFHGIVGSIRQSRVPKFERERGPVARKDLEDETSFRRPDPFFGPSDPGDFKSQDTLFGPFVAGVNERLTMGDLRRDERERQGLPRTSPVVLPTIGAPPFSPGGVLQSDTDVINFPRDLALDVAVDPITPATVGILGKKGALLRQSTRKLEIGFLSRNPNDILAAAREVAEASPTSKEMSQHLLNLRIAEENGDFTRIVQTARKIYVEGALPELPSEQARRGLRGIVGFAGAPVVKGAPVFEAFEKGGAALREVKVVRDLEEAFVKYAGVPEALRAYGQTAEFAQHVAQQELTREWVKYAREIDVLARKAGVDPKDARAALFYAKEMSRVSPDLNILSFLSPTERRKYVRWMVQGNAAQQGFDVAQPRLSAALNRAAEVDARAARAHTLEGREALSKLADDIAIDVEKNIGGIPGGTPGPAKRTAGGPKSGATHEQSELASRGVGSEPTIRTTKRGNVQTTGALPNVLGAEGAYVGKGSIGPSSSIIGMPEDMLALLPDNTQRRIREFEMRAVERAKERNVLNAVENAFEVFGIEGGVSGELGKGSKGLVELFNARTTQIAADDVAAGLKGSVLGGDFEYMRHLTRPEALEHIRKHGPKEMRGLSNAEMTEKLGEEIQRMFSNKTAFEVNQIVETQGSRITGFRPLKGGLFVEDPFLAMIVREQNSARARAVKKLFDDGVREYGVIAPKGSAAEKEAIRKGWRKLKSSLPELQDAYIPEPIARWWNNIEEKMIAPSFMPELRRKHKQWNRIWKGWTLGTVPATQTRNAISDFVMAIVVGDQQFGSMPIHMLAEGLGDVNQAIGGSPSAIWKAAERLGVVNSGQIQELEQTVLGPIKNGTFNVGRFELSRNKNPFNENSVWFQVSQEIANGRENVVKYSFFRWLIKKGAAPEDAAVRTKLVFFDYVQGLTNLEKGLRGEAIPFYAWARFNFPLQVYTAITRPGRLGVVQKAREELRGDESLGLPQAALPDFLSEGLPIRLGGRDKKKATFLRMESLLPQGDLSNLARPLDFLAGAVAPIPSAALQIATGVRPFGSKFSEGTFRRLEQGGDVQNFLGIKVSSRFAMPILSAIRPLAELNRLLNRPGPVPRDPRFPAPSLTSRILGNTVARPFEVDIENAIDFDELGFRRKLNELQRKVAKFEAKGDTVNADIEIKKLDLENDARELLDIARGKARQKSPE